MDELTGKRIVILGLARQGVALARYAAEVGAEVIVSDLRPPSALTSTVEQLQDLEIQYVLGEHPLNLLDSADVVALSGGVPTDSPFVIAAREQGIPVTNDSLEFVKRAPAPVVGITGSAGKTTTTALTGAMLRAEGRTTWVGGNIGNPLIAELAGMDENDVVVQELSSFQLELWSPEWGYRGGRGPQVAAVLNVTPNHLDRHKTMDAYTAAKANILRFQKEGDTAVLCADDPGAYALHDRVCGRLRLFSKRQAVGDGAYVAKGALWLQDETSQRRICAVEDVQLRGGHNLLNVLAAATLADTAGASAGAIREAISTFTGVAHRLELVATVNGVRWINDSIATAPERALAAIDAFAEPLVLLAGGRDKAMVWDEWARRVAERVRHVVLFGDLAEMLDSRLGREQDGGVQRTRVETLEEAVTAAASIARAGEVVLLSPGGTSYDAFQDFEERGACFRQLVQELS